LDAKAFIGPFLVKPIRFVFGLQPFDEVVCKFHDVMPLCFPISTKRNQRNFKQTIETKNGLRQIDIIISEIANKNSKKPFINFDGFFCFKMALPH